MGTPQPLDDPGGRITAVPVATAGVQYASGVPAPGMGVGAVARPAPGTFEQLHDELRSHGVTWWRLEAVGTQGDYRFICAIPNRSQPSTRANYEVVANGERGLTAMRAVLDKIRRDQP
jgi:hypothetical protein